MAGGRPTSYSQEILDLARMYLDNLPEDEVVHSIEGLADYTKLNRSTIYDWESQGNEVKIDEEGNTITSPLKEFSNIVEDIRHKQAKTLINKGLDGKFTPAITKVMLSKHGYREGIEQMGKDGKDLIPPTITEEEKQGLLSLLK